MLQALGLPFSEARQTIERFREHDEALLREGREHQGDLDKLTQLAARGRAELELIFSEDNREQRAVGGSP